jgi:type IV pilus assembly protein PilP
MRSLFVLLASSLFLIGLAGCGSDPVPLNRAKAPAAPVAVKVKSALPSLPALAGGGQQLSDLTGNEEISFDPKGLRNPFKPFLKMKAPKKKTSTKAMEKIKLRTPLQRFALEQLSLVGIFWSKDMAPNALIQDPAGKGYNVGIGTYVGDRGGKIVKINPKEILVEERTVDILGEPIVKQEKIMLHKFGNEVTR